MPKKHMKRCSTSYVTTEIQIKTTKMGKYMRNVQIKMLEKEEIKIALFIYNDILFSGKHKKIN